MYLAPGDQMKRTEECGSQIEEESESESEVAQSCPTLRDPMDCSPPGSSIHRIFQARVLEWGAIAFSIQIANFCYKHTF